MTFRFAKLQNFGFKFTALWLCLWLSGAACAATCATTDLRAAFALETNPAIQSTEKPSCHAHAEVAANADEPAKTDKDGFSIKASEYAPTLACCTFLNLTAERAQKQSHADAQTQIATAPIIFALPKLGALKSSPAKPAYQTIPLNRGSTYLHNCVFLI